MKRTIERLALGTGFVVAGLMVLAMAGCQQATVGGTEDDEVPIAVGPNSCEYANDGDCDEGTFCAVGTDAADCAEDDPPTGDDPQPLISAWVCTVVTVRDVQLDRDSWFFEYEILNGCTAGISVTIHERTVDAGVDTLEEAWTTGHLLVYGGTQILPPGAVYNARGSWYRFQARLRGLPDYPPNPLLRWCARYADRTQECVWQTTDGP